MVRGRGSTVAFRPHGGSATPKEKQRLLAHSRRQAEERRAEKAVIHNTILKIAMRRGEEIMKLERSIKQGQIPRRRSKVSFDDFDEGGWY